MAGQLVFVVEAVGRDYLRAVDKLLVPDKAVREAARKLERAPSTLARFVQQEVTYKAIEFGRGARIPRAPHEVLRHRYGDCKDHALLLYHLLRNAGTEARLAPGAHRQPGPAGASLARPVRPHGRVPARDGSFVDATNKSADLSRA